MFRGRSGYARVEGTKMLENAGVFRHSLVPLKGFSSVACRGEESEKHRLENTVWNPYQKAADVWEKDVWEFQVKSGSSGSCCLFLYFLGKIAVQEMSGRTPGSPRHPSCRHPRPSDLRFSGARAMAENGPSKKEPIQRSMNYLLQRIYILDLLFERPCGFFAYGWEASCLQWSFLSHSWK